MKYLWIALLVVMLPACGALWPTEPSGTKIDVDKNEGVVNIEVNDNDVLIGTNGPTGDINVDTGEGGCCNEEQATDKCWSSCESKNPLLPEQCEACARGERSCVWPWQVDAECLAAEQFAAPPTWTLPIDEVL